jgi:N-acetylglucosamine-6-phosphate deacetylase
MDGAAANMMTAGIGPAEAVAAATRLPADLVGRPGLGRIAPAAAADLAWLDDDMRTRATGSVVSLCIRGLGTVKPERGGGRR